MYTDSTYIHLPYIIKQGRHVPGFLKLLLSGKLACVCVCVWGEVSCRIAQASRAFGNLRDSVFTASDLTMETKRIVY